MSFTPRNHGRKEEDREDDRAPTARCLPLFFCCGFGKESVVAVLFVDFLDFVFAEGPVFTIAKHPK